MAKCFRCESEIDTTGAVQFVDHHPVHSGTDACNNALLKDYQAKLDKVEQFAKTQQAEENARVLAAQDAEKAKLKAEQDLAIKKEAEEAEKAKHPVQAGQHGPFGFQQVAGSPLTPEQQKAKDEADRKRAGIGDSSEQEAARKKAQDEADAKKKADADEAARRAQAKKNAGSNRSSNERG